VSRHVVLIRASALALPALSSLAACNEHARTAAQGRHDAAIVYGQDDRSELYELADDPRSRIADAAVALLPRSALANRRGPELARDLPSWEEDGGLCPGEPFGDQPVAAFCSGVLVDWDLVLTVAHCVEDIPLDEVAMVMGFYYIEPGVLGSAPEDVLQPTAIVDATHGVGFDDSLLDYAWVRLAQPAPPWRRPAPLRATPAPVIDGESLALMGSAGGTPLKLDFGATVLDARPDQLDYFAADTDTSRGSSGSGAYDQQLVLSGILARGGEDFEQTEQGCLTTRREAAANDVQEELTYVHQALAGLCSLGARTSSLCRADCGDPCEASPRPEPSDEGCSLSGGAGARQPRAAALAALLLIGAGWLRSGRRARLNRSGS
jgi:hypothetical protein